MIARDRLAADGVTRQHPYEVVESLCSKPYDAGQLPEKGAGLAAEGEDPARVEVAKGTFTISQLEIVCDEPAALDGEDEAAVGRFFSPSREYGGRLEAVERSVQLDGVEAAARVREPSRLRETLGIEGAPPSRVVVAADADEIAGTIAQRTSSAADVKATGRQVRATSTGCVITSRSCVRKAAGPALSGNACNARRTSSSRTVKLP